MSIHFDSDNGMVYVDTFCQICLKNSCMLDLGYFIRMFLFFYHYRVDQIYF